MQRANAFSLSVCLSVCLSVMLQLLKAFTWKVHFPYTGTASELASCLINAQPLPAHSSAADDNSLIGCTSHDLTDDWSLARTHFVDSQYPFWCTFGCVLLLNQMFENNKINNVLFENTAPIYLVNLLWKLGLGI